MSLTPFMIPPGARLVIDTLTMSTLVGKLRADDFRASPIDPPTSEPSSPNYQVTIAASDFPSQSIESYMAHLAVGGSTMDTGLNAVRAKMTLNGVDASLVGGPIDEALADNQPFWSMQGVWAVNAIQAGDTVGYKIWVDIASEIEVRYAALTILPRKLRMKNIDVVSGRYTVGNDFEISHGISGVADDFRTNGNINYEFMGTAWPLISATTTLLANDVLEWPETHRMDGGLDPSASLIGFRGNDFETNVSQKLTGRFVIE